MTNDKWRAQAVGSAAEIASPPAAAGSRHTRRGIAMLTLASMCQFVDRSLVGITLDPLRNEFAFSDAQLGVMGGAAYSIPFACAVLPMGVLVDRTDRVRLLTLLLVLWSLATLLTGLASGFLMLLAMRAIVGIAESGGGPASLSLLSSTVPHARRGSAIGIFMLANAAGTIVTFGGAGLLVAHYGWRSAYLIAGAAGLLLAVAMPPTLRPLGARPERTDPARAESALRVLRRLAGRPALRQLAVASALATALMVGLWVWATSFFVRVHGMSLPNAGLIVAAGAGVCAGAGTFVAGWATDRLGTARALRIPVSALGALTVACLAIAAAGTASGAILAFLLTSFLAPMFLAPSYHAVLGLVAPHERGIALAGVQMATGVLGSAFGPATVGIVSGISGSLTLALVPLAVAGPIAALLFDRARRRMETGRA